MIHGVYYFVKMLLESFLLGQEVATLGIKTNQMEYVLELDIYLSLPNGDKIKPCLLQYSLECPYRITGCAFHINEGNKTRTDKWETMNENVIRTLFNCC